MSFKSRVKGRGSDTHTGVLQLQVRAVEQPSSLSATSWH